MNTNDNDSGSKVVDFIQTKTKQMGTSENDTFLTDGFETFEALKEGMKGFLVVSFDKEGEVSLFYSGELDLPVTLGALDIMKDALLTNLN